MAAGVVQMLHKSLKDAQKDLISTDDAIKRLTGRDPGERPPPRRFSGPGPGPGPIPAPGPERRISNGGRMRAWSGNFEAPPASKRRDLGGRVSSRSFEIPPASKRRDSEGGRPRVTSRLGSGGRDGPGAKSKDPFSSNPRLAGRLGPPPELSAGGSEGEEEEEEEEERPRKRPGLQSSVVATKVPLRPSVRVEDEDSKKRNRRMFGFLMGTLQKFKESEETMKNTDKERRRQEIEEKVQQTQEIEKAAAVQERKDLFQQRKQQKTKIARLADQMEVVAMYEDWNAHDKKLIGYIKTKVKPHIYYLPVAHNSKTQKLLGQSSQAAQEKLKKREEELEVLLMERSKREEEGDMEEGTSLVEHELMEDGKEEGVGGEREGKGSCESGEASE